MDAAARSPRRRRLALGLAAFVVLGWYGGKALVRRHVDGLIHGREGAALAEFTLRDQGGGEWSPARLRGRPAVLHFVRSRCEACAHEAAEYRSFEQRVTPDRATILHVVTDAVLDFPAAETAATIAQKGFARPVLLADRAFVDAFHSVRWANVTPVTYVVDAQGAIRTALRGAQTAAALEAALATVE